MHGFNKVITIRSKSKLTMSIAAEVHDYLFWEFDKATGYKRIPRKTFRSIPGKKCEKIWRKIRWTECKNNRGSI